MIKRPIKQVSILDHAIRRLTFMYLILSVGVTTIFTISPLVAQQFFVIENESVVVFDANGQQMQAEEIINNLRQKAASQFIGAVIILNLGVLFVISITCYKFAKKTLLPLQKVLDNQASFAAEIAHEFRTPLARALLELDTAKSHSNPNSSHLETLESVEKELIQLKEVSRSTLSLLTLDKEQPRRTIISLLPIVQRLERTTLALARSKGISFTLVADVDVQVMSNENEIQQLFTILIDNAITYTDPGGEIALTLKKNQSMAVISISDTGIGIAPEELEAIFLPRYRIDPTNGTGSGLGLSIARRIADDLKASFDVESTPGKGTKFTLFIPTT